VLGANDGLVSVASLMLGKQAAVLSGNRSGRHDAVAAGFQLFRQAQHGYCAQLHLHNPTSSTSLR
jgi:hypothetical protein